MTWLWIFWTLQTEILHSQYPFAIFCEAFGKSHPLIIRQDENSKQRLWLLWNYWCKDKFLFLYQWLQQKLLLEGIQHCLYFPNTLWVEIISNSYQKQFQNCPCFISLEGSEKKKVLDSKPFFLSLQLGIFFVQELFSCLKKFFISLADTLPKPPWQLLCILVFYAICFQYMVCCQKDQGSQPSTRITKQYRRKQSKSKLTVYKQLNFLSGFILCPHLLMYKERPPRQQRTL